MRRAVLLVFIVLVSSSWMANSQEIYRWVDEKGIIHFADDFTLVPEKYRDQIQKRKPPETVPPSSSPSPSPIRPPGGTAAAGTTESAPERKDLLGRGGVGGRGGGEEG